ncbi:MAG: alpha-galactosidase [Planctomycetia bacterium]|nr:alpha-galactosidase [Planctomycetia bacterium]
MKHFLILLTFMILPFFSGTAFGQESDFPFSFSYKNQPIRADRTPLQWEMIEEKENEFSCSRGTYIAPDGKLQVQIDVKSYNNHFATEYSARLTNLSTSEETDIISDFQTLDLSFPLFVNEEQLTLRTLKGSNCGPDDFTPVTVDLKSGQSHIFATPSGRSSNEYMPFIEIDDASNGYLFAVAWTGGWKAQFEKKDQDVNVKIGMNKTHFKLLPGESVLQPGVTVFQRTNQSRREFKTQVHQFMMNYIVPRDVNGDIIPPILAVAAGGGNKTPEMMQAVLQYVLDNQMPFDTYWIDAGWYGAPHEDEHYGNCGPNWAKYVGDWRFNTVTHPTGDLLPIANAIHQANMKFLLWFEPERIEDGAPILEEHPEYRHFNLLDYGNPDALKYIQETVYGIIEKHNIDIFREDFNMDPGNIWRILDEENPDRVGIYEAKHIEGLYKFLDDMRAKFPNILQENCASGGRRLDIEMISRAHSYCRSDYYIGQKPGDSAFSLGQIATLNTIPYIPFQGCEFNCVPVGDDYAAFSIISSGTVITFSDFDGGVVRRDFSDEETAWFKKIFAVAHRMKQFYLGNFYQLTDEVSEDDSIWCGWQCDRADLNAGFALVFRRAASTEESKTFNLGNIDPEANYEVETYNAQPQTVSGEELVNWKVDLPPRSFRLIFYKKK